LVDGFRQPDLVGGLSELVESAAGFPVLELPLLFELLDAYGQKVLWGAVGWFLATYRKTFFVSDKDLALIEKQVPNKPRPGLLFLDPRGIGRLIHSLVPSFL